MSKAAGAGDYREADGPAQHAGAHTLLRFLATDIPGAFVIEPKASEDSRGLFARTFCAREFARAGIHLRIAQCGTSFNPRRGTLRGMHYQTAPHAEAKLVRCTRGAIYDVMLDIRESSPAYRRWVAAELTAENRRMVFIPEGVAHGFQTLADDSEVSYEISEFYHPECAGGRRWNDPAFQIAWPETPRVISERDANFELAARG